jgi:peroxiredoxin
MTPVLTPKKGRKEGISVATALTEGVKAPAFDLPRDGGGRVSLADFKGKKLVIYFYPKADTPGCTRESIDFSQLHAEFEKTGTEVLGVSADPVTAQDKFKKKHALKLALLSDETHKMLEAYGVWGEKIHVRPDVYGNRPQHLPDRRGWKDCPYLAQGEGRRPRCRGARGSQGAVAGRRRQPTDYPRPISGKLTIIGSS